MKIKHFIEIIKGTECDIKFPPTSFEYSSRTRESFEYHGKHGTRSEPYFGVKSHSLISKKVGSFPC